MRGGVTTSILQRRSPSSAVSSYPACLGNKKEGSALDSPFGGRIACSGGLNLPLFVQAYTFSIALTVTGSASLNSQSCKQMESHVKLSFLLSFGKVTCTMV
ncbi:uncharacterized protein G2W53_003366 [Senna tora]|uniref:Uncharacterized protein n=1 Tax=Senna tora TaxID=362788 RepID=A0A834XB57_9FABA|nr:uncharacterized protein G2W53_003366 [Senna tora]